MMKKFLCLFGLLTILGACHREEEESGPEQLVVGAANIEGTWIWQAEGEMTAEIMKFTADGDFYFANSLENITFDDQVAGSYNVISSNASVMASYRDTKLNFTVTSLTANEMTISHKTSGATATYARHLVSLEISHNMSFKPDYSLYVAGNIKSFHSRNDKTATVDKYGTIVGKSEGITLIDVITNEGTAVVLVKVDGLIYDYTQAIGLTRDEVCAAYGTPVDATEETVYYRDNEKMMIYDINKRTRLVDAIHITYNNKKGFSNADLVDYLSNKYYTYTGEAGFRHAFTNAATYETSNVMITFDGTKHLAYTYINHDLFEDFSVALGKSRDEVVYMYGDDLECLAEQASFVKYSIDDEVQGYPGADIMEEVKFSFYNGTTTLVELRLHNQLKQEAVTSFLKSRYSYNSDNSNSRHQFYYDKARKLVIDYIPEDCEICYYFEE